MIFKIGDKVLLNEKEFKSQGLYEKYFTKWDGKPLTIKEIYNGGMYPIQTKEKVNGFNCWKRNELILAREENEL